MSAQQLILLPSAVLLTATLLVTGCVVYGSPTDQDKQLWSNHGPEPLTWVDCCECFKLIRMFLFVNLHYYRSWRPFTI